MVEGLGSWNFKRFATIRPGALCFVLVFLFALCLTRLKISRWERALPEEACEFAGVVTDPGHALPGQVQTARAQKIVLTDGTPVLIRMKSPARRGDQVRGKVVFRCAEGVRNPGGFSERNWLWSKGAVWTGYADSTVIIPRDGVFHKLARVPDRIRDHVRLHLSALWEGGAGPLLLSLTTGDTRLLDDRTSYRLRAAGLSHLTCVSGTHLMLLLGPASWLAKRAGMTRKRRRRVTLILVFLPGVLSGWRSGISRASFAALAGRLDPLMKQRRDSLNLLLFVGSALLVLHPYSLYDTSYWMSLSAAGAVSLTARRLSRAKRTSLFYRVRSTFMYSVVAQMVILPYQITASPGIHLIAPLANVLALPLAAALMAATYPAIFILAVLPRFSRSFLIVTTFFSRLLTPPADLFLWLAKGVAQSNYSFIHVKWVLLVIPAAVYWITVKSGKKGKVHSRAAILVGLSAIWLSGVWLFCFRPQESQILFLDVGQGDATLFLPKQGQTLLIDGGDRGHGYHTVIPAVRMQALNSIDWAVVTHAHSDHAGGIAELVEVGFIRHLCLPAVDADPLDDLAHEEDMTAYLLDLCEQSNIPVTRLQAGDTMDLRNGRLEVIHPDARRGSVDLNEASLVMRVTMDGLSVLMTGDLTEEGERLIVYRGADCSADILHVAHHGSRYSSSAVFLEACGAGTALISSGRNNRYGHPHPDVLARLQEREMALFRTDESGAVFLKISSGKGRMKAWLTK